VHGERLTDARDLINEGTEDLRHSGGGEYFKASHWGRGKGGPDGGSIAGRSSAGLRSQEVTGKRRSPLQPSNHEREKWKGKGK